MSLILYVTGHGYGHATRQSALARALLDGDPELDLEIRTEAPAWLLRESCPGVPVSAGGADLGLVQRDAFDADLGASLAVQRRLDADWPRLVAEEAAWLRRRGARLVVSDIAPLAFDAAAAAGVPSIGVSNFAWDWIFEPYEEQDPRWGPARRRCAAAYGKAELAYRLPMHGDFPSFRRVLDAPLLSRVRRLDAAAWRRSRGLPERAPLVLAAFGGYGAGDFSFKAADDLSAFAFAGFGPKPAGLDAPWLALRSSTSADQLDAMAACDVVLTKPGYGMFSEALAHGKRVVYVPREGFRETDRLVESLERRGACAALPRRELAAGRWRAALDAVLAGEPPAAVPAEGAAWLAGRLLSRLRQ